MFKKIMFATTASSNCDDAAKVAFDLADKYNSELTVFHAYGVPDRTTFGPLMKDPKTGEVKEFDRNYETWAEEEIRSIYKEEISKAKNCRIEIAGGFPHTEILRAARKNNADLIVMGAHSRKEELGATRFRSVVGTTMQKVAQKSRAPILIVSRPCTTCFWYFNNIMCGVDFSKGSFSAFKFAYKTAKEIGCRLYLFHCVDISTLQAGKAKAQSEIEDKIILAKEKIKTHYLSEMDDYDNYEVTIWEGVPYVELLKFSREKSIDLIVMAHDTKDTEEDETILGSTVEQVVLRASCPVASVNRPNKI
ncbi:MAG: universal stress protein [Proteobacteria bacterium]|nr:universal stress protein [Pseudomonadota bacterium]